ncbi:hypothetical protein PUMCH_003859 [Australozyma saopauloensis]|uniref:Uncharacterized protein n=1 Tax=Australozyma saopauloensis TaxID=291208 RepID=A0AAX4HD26_9ASCO|nr:hypothetical protein PUMCH_003859 [[Candida] saopauloensis]
MRYSNKLKNNSLSDPQMSSNGGIEAHQWVDRTYFSELCKKLLRSKTQKEKQSRTVKYGQYRGQLDVRGTLCYHTECQRKGYACCSHCNSLPHNPSLLRNSITCANSEGYASGNISRKSIDTKLSLLLVELQELADYDRRNLARLVVKASLSNPIIVNDENATPVKKPYRVNGQRKADSQAREC